MKQQAEQEKTNMSLEQRQQESIMQPEIEAEHHINALFGELVGILKNPNLTPEVNLKQRKAVCKKFLTIQQS